MTPGVSRNIALFVTCSTFISCLLSANKLDRDFTSSLGVEIPIGARVNLSCFDAYTSHRDDGRYFFRLSFPSDQEATGWLDSIGFRQTVLSEERIAGWLTASPPEVRSRARCSWTPEGSPSVLAIFELRKSGEATNIVAFVQNGAVWGRAQQVR